MPCRIVAAFSASRTPLPVAELEAEPRFLIVDGEGRGRGIYPISVEGVDEVFHRAKRVWDTE